MKGLQRLAAGTVAALVVMVVMVVMVPRLALAADAAAGARAELSDERGRIERHFAAEQALCRERFAVTDCMNEVRTQRRNALAPLRERELRLGEAERRERALQRRRAVADRRALAATRAPVAEAPRTLRRGPLPPASASRGGASARVGPDADQREAEAAARARATQRRQEQIEGARRRIEARQSEKQSAGRRSDPLPVPGPAIRPP